MFICYWLCNLLCQPNIVTTLFAMRFHLCWFHWNVAVIAAYGRLHRLTRSCQRHSFRRIKPPASKSVPHFHNSKQKPLVVRFVQSKGCFSAAFPSGTSVLSNNKFVAFENYVNYGSAEESVIHANQIMLFIHLIHYCIELSAVRRPPCDVDVQNAKP